MNKQSFNDKRSINMKVYGKASGTLAVLRVDTQGQPVLREDATQTIVATALNMRDLTSLDAMTATATGFDIRGFGSNRDAIVAAQNADTVLSNTATLVLGGTTVLTVDMSPYSTSTFLVIADSISLLTSVYLQLAPVNDADYFTTVASETGLVLGGEYLLLPTAPMHYARIYATGIGSVLTAYYFGQA